jgi:hypothetical protein
MAVLDLISTQSQRIVHSRPCESLRPAALPSAHGHMGRNRCPVEPSPRTLQLDCLCCTLLLTLTLDPVCVTCPGMQSSNRALVWNVLFSASPSAPLHSPIEYVLDTHTRSITDINWAVFHFDVLATCGLDSWTWIWDLRSGKTPVAGYCAWNGALSACICHRNGSRLTYSCLIAGATQVSHNSCFLPRACSPSRHNRSSGIDRTPTFSHLLMTIWSIFGMTA